MLSRSDSLCFSTHQPSHIKAINYGSNDGFFFSSLQFSLHAVCPLCCAPQCEILTGRAATGSQEVSACTDPGAALSVQGQRCSTTLLTNNYAQVLKSVLHSVTLDTRVYTDKYGRIVFLIIFSFILIHLFNLFLSVSSFSSLFPTFLPFFPRPSFALSFFTSSIDFPS